MGSTKSYAAFRPQKSEISPKVKNRKIEIFEASQPKNEAATPKNSLNVFLTGIERKYFYFQNVISRPPDLDLFFGGQAPFDLVKIRQSRSDTMATTWGQKFQKSIFSFKNKKYRSKRKNLYGQNLKWLRTRFLENGDIRGISGSIFGTSRANLKKLLGQTKRPIVHKYIFINCPH